MTRWSAPVLALADVEDAANVADAVDVGDVEDVDLLVQDDAEDCVGAVGGWQHVLDGEDGGEDAEQRVAEDVVEDGVVDGVVDGVADGVEIVVADGVEDGVEGVAKDAAECAMEDAVADAVKGVVEDAAMDAGSVVDGVDGAAFDVEGSPGTVHHWDSWGAALGSQSWQVEGSLGTARPFLAAAAVAGSTGGTGSRVGSLSTGACGVLGSGPRWLFLPVGRRGAPEDLGSSLAVGLDRRWGQCRFGEVLGSGGMEGCVGKIWQQLGGSDSTRTDGKVPRSEESASLKGRSHPCSAAVGRQLEDDVPDEGERS